MPGAGFDWLPLNMVHSANEMDTILQQLQTVAAYDVHPVVRPVWKDPLAIKRLLEMSAQPLLIPLRPESR